MTQLITPFITFLVGFLLGVCLGGLCIYLTIKENQNDSRLV